MSPRVMLLDSRGSSVELVSSILTAGLRSRLPSLPPLTSLNSGLGTSDSESDDAYVLRTRSTMSPQTSVLSLLSLKGRAGKLLTISGASAPHLHIFSGYRFPNSICACACGTVLQRAAEDARHAHAHQRQTVG